MSGPHRNPDKLNTIGVVVVGICGAVLVYVTIVALQAFYMNDTSELQTNQDYGGQDAKLKAIRADQQRNINELGLNQGATPTYHIPIDRAMNLVVESAKVDPSTLVPALGRSATATICPQFGRPVDLKMCGRAPAGAGSGAGSAAGSGAGSAADSGSGSGSGSAAAGSAGSGGNAP